MNIQEPKPIEYLEVKKTTSLPQTTSKKTKWGLVAFLLFVVITWFASGWGNLSKQGKEKLYEELVVKEQLGELSEDSVSILCQLAKELKKDIPEICNESAVYAKTTGKNGKHVNKKRKDTAYEKMVVSKQKRDSLRMVPNKTPAIKKALEKAEKEYNTNKEKYEYTGENHSQKNKR